MCPDLVKSHEVVSLEVDVEPGSATEGATLRSQGGTQSIVVKEVDAEAFYALIRQIASLF